MMNPAHDEQTPAVSRLTRWTRFLRRGILAPVLVIVAVGAVWFIRTNRLYFYWRFTDENVGLMSTSFDLGQLKPRHIRKLLTRGATPGVQGAAMSIIADSDAFEKPYPAGVVADILDIVRNLPDDRHERGRLAWGVIMLVESSPQEDLFPAVRMLATHSDPHIRQDVSYVLVYYGDEAFPLLERLSTDPDMKVRLCTTLHLASYGAAGIPLLDRLREDPEPEVRAAAVSCIGRLYRYMNVDAHDYWPVFRKLLASPDEDILVRKAALRSLWLSEQMSIDELETHTRNENEELAAQAKGYLEESQE